MRISSRDNFEKKAYMGQSPDHEPVYQPSIFEPSTDGSGKYAELSDEDFCSKCKNQFKKVFDPETNQWFAYCKKCDARHSLKSFNRHYSTYGMQPGTLNTDSGSSVNNASDHSDYHGPVVRDTFSGNLGKN